MKVIAVMPAYNAAATLRRTFDAIPKDIVQEVIVADNASTDETAVIAQGIAGLTLIRHERNRGYGGSQKSLYTEALRRGADIVVMIHADGQYDPAKVREVIAPLLSGTADMVSGSRFLDGDPRKKGMPAWRYAANRFLTSVQNAVLGTHLTDGHSGYRAYGRGLLEAVSFVDFSDDFVFDAQMIAAVARRGLRIAEIPVPVRYEKDSSSISLFPSIRYGCATIWATLMQR